MKKWHLWLGVLISALFLWLALRGLHLGDFWGAVQKANYIWLIPGVGVYFIGVWIRAWRWHYLLGPIKQIPTKTMFPITTIGYMGNNIYPARAGEVLRAVILKRREGVPVSASLATIIVERIFDGLVMLAFIFVNLTELAKLTGASGFVGNIQEVAIWGSAVFMVALFAFLLAAAFPFHAEKIATWFISRFVPEKVRRPGAWFKGLFSLALRLAYRRGGAWIERGLENGQDARQEVEVIPLRGKTLEITKKFLTGLQSLRSPFNVLMVFFTSVIIWLLETGKYWFVMHAFDFEVSFFALMLMNGIVNLATTIPSAPGYIGTFDAPGIAVLTAYGVDQATAAGYTLVLHVALWLPITLLGGYYLTREGIKWSDTLRTEVEK
ncbi:MAG TPA: lysylphosphatidylglycerol synthase transmembrane domain-containing protein [Anaerolineales bacterium]|nr:lysylphosphatidylglycerol synthase transmembrane domain-containing protein [Anaerolineales bacterium]